MVRRCPTRLLSDEPAEKDEFGSHERIANAIYELVKNESGRKAIALMGSWGSGKSTVVKLLKSLAKMDEGRMAVFVFDAWAHQGDPLRRSFLERFINFMIDQGWIEKEKWQGPLDSLSRRQEKNEITSEPILTRPGKFVAIGLALIPIGSAFLSLRSYLEWFGYVGFVLMSAPLIAVLLTWLIYRTTWKFWQFRFWKENRPPYQDADLWAFFVQKTRETHRTTTIRTPDPTSIEFANLFFAIISETMSNENRRLIVVIDNLDRLDPQEALTIWSTMKTFFEVDSGKNASWLDRFWLLVSYDFTSLDRLWGAATGGSKELVSAFTAKTFQLTFHLSPPILSDWCSFLKTKLREAFPNHKEEEVDVVCRMYRLYRLQENQIERPITPRDIKLFVNRIGALHSQWEDQVPLPMQALYALYEKDIEKILKILKRPGKDQSNEIPSSILSVINEPEWQRYLASLHFNVPPDKSLQVLIGPRIEKALMEGNAEDLKELLVPGFWELIEHILDERGEEWTKSPNQTGGIPLAAHALNTLIEKAPNSEAIWHSLKLKVKRVSSAWQPFNKLVGEGLSIIIQHIPEQEKEAIARNILHIVKRTPPDEKSPNEWLGGAMVLIKCIHEANLVHVLKSSFFVHGSAAAYIQIIKLLSHEKHDRRYAPYFIPEQSGEEIIKEFENFCREGKLKVYADAIRLILEISVSKSWPWDQLVDAIDQRFNANIGDMEEIKELLRILFDFYYEPKMSEKAKTILEKLTRRGRIFHYLYQASNSNENETVAWLIAAILEFNPAGKLDESWINAGHGRTKYNEFLGAPQGYPNVVKTYSEICIQRNYLETLISLTESAANTRQWVMATLEYLVDKNPDFFLPSKVISKYDVLIGLLSKNALGKVITHLTQKGDLLPQLTKEPFNKKLADLYLQALQVLSPANQAFYYLSFLSAALQGLSKSDWEQQLRDEGRLAEMAIMLIEKGANVQFSQSFGDALLEHAKQLLNRQLEVRRLQKNWSRLPDALETSQRKTFWRNLRDELLNKKPIASILPLYGENLSKSGTLEEKADDVVRHLFASIVDRLILEELEWLHNLIKYNTRIIQEAKSESVNAFRQRIVEALNRGDISNNSVREKLQNISIELERNINVH